MSEKILALTMGDPAGIGIEISAKAWSKRRETSLPVFCLIGDRRIIEKSLQDVIPFKVIGDLSNAPSVFENALPVYDTGPASTEAEATLQAIQTAVRFCLSGEVDAVVTNPIQKKRLYDAGFQHPGHTEYLAELTHSSGKAVMMLACDSLKVVPATIHIPITDVPSALTPDLLEHVIRTTEADLKTRFGLKKPNVVVAGLNPHAGEGGSIGNEEQTVIIPVIHKLRNEGLNITGPSSADTLFHAAARAGYDAAICMYHDQALIPIKTIDFDNGVNVTLGLPIIRTSPDHGTAEDIAGKGIANPASLIAALKLAGEMASHTRNSG
ncbi:4-hydroxythreonine-4-phosphate dehydrogenase PdxA [Sneathiella aquimaris]|uniref:4-hydroxythreonine-4-phosphate dehydrogenase PdxA n=1 Tax=Sneathiella aquimaris TaxID=2599305 RepID=UPI00146ECF51|nr:4-hydroxythreonine-4-phosphate dehydrogenase PdxA [Sneathiella aquimaris]